MIVWPRGLVDLVFPSWRAYFAWSFIFIHFIVVSFLLDACLLLLNLPFLGANRFAGKGDQFPHLIRYHHP